MSTRRSNFTRKSAQPSKSNRTITTSRSKKKNKKRGKNQNPDISSSIPPARKKRRYKSGTVALREIRAQQKTIEFAIPRLPLSRVVREVSTSHKQDLRWQKSALHCLQTATEQFLIDMFQDANLLAIHGKRVTLMKKDLDLVKILQPDKFPDSMHTRYYCNWHNHIPRALLNTRANSKEGKSKARSYAKK